MFEPNGEILLHQSGPRAGQAYLISGCFYRVYVQFGGTSGWLGLPTGEVENSPDGSSQRFEGGVIRYTRAYGDCEATPAESDTTSSAPSSQSDTNLDLFENSFDGEQLSLASLGSIEMAMKSGFVRKHHQARVFDNPVAGAIPLNVFLNETSGRRQVIASTQSTSDAIASGYAFESRQGYVWKDPHPGCGPLMLFRDPKTGRTRLALSAIESSDAERDGYRFVRVEGFAMADP